MATRSFFHLRKWYGDCVAADGAAFIGYSATLRVGPFSVPYQATLLSVGGQPLRETSVLRRRGRPTSGDGRFRWVSSPLSVDASWTRAASAIREVLLDVPGLRIAWTCHFPRADAEVRVAGRELRGTGYVEELDVLGDPRRIPIRELRWGRYHGDGGWVVWIEWLGSRPLRRVWVDGVPADGAVVSEDGVLLDASRALTFDAPRPLRSGDVSESVLPGRWWLRWLIPASLRHLDERKWVARATLRDVGGASAGWALYETVRWS